MDLLGKNMERHRKNISDANDTFNKVPVTWLRSNGGLDYNGEDNLGENFSTITLSAALFLYNAFRTWKLTRFEEMGSIDEESCVLILNKRYLGNLGYLNVDGYFDFDPAADRFISNGIKYKAVGDTPTAQAGDEIMLFYIILQRDSVPTGKGYHE